MTHPLSQPEFDVVIARDVMIPMRDGTRLATDVHRPARDGEPLPGPFPLLLIRTPYDKSAPAQLQAPAFWAERGYISAVQDVRGRFASEGRFYLLRDEGPDGYDAIEWLAAQSWCDGNIGMHGTSYLAWVQNAAACHNPPQLKAIWPNQGASNGLTSSLRQGGALELRWLSWAFWGGAVSKEANADPVLAAALEQAAGPDFRSWLKRLPLKRGHNPLSLIPDYEEWALDLYETATSDAALWQTTGMNFEAHVDNHSDVPSTYSGGWYDSYTRATTENFATFNERKTAPQRLIMGPWTHGAAPLDRTFSGDVDLGPEAPIAGNLAADFRHLMLRFFDRHLKGTANGWDDEPPVKLFVMGGGSGKRLTSGRLDHGGHWRDEQEWPLKRATATKYYLRAGGELSTDPSAETVASTTFAFDPAHPVPTISANISSLAEYVPEPEGTTIPIRERRVLVVAQGGSDQREREDVFGCEPPYLPLAARPDVVVFRTTPIAEDTEVTGPITVRLWAATDSIDTDFTAKLIDVYPANDDYPEGYALNISDSIKRVRFRNGYERESFVEPGEVFEVSIELYPTSNVFAAGHRIRVDISSSNFPRFDVNPNTGEPLGRHTRTRIAQNTVYFDASCPSHIELPVVPKS